MTRTHRNPSVLYASNALFEDIVPHTGVDDQSSRSVYCRNSSTIMKGRGGKQTHGKNKAAPDHAALSNPMFHSNVTVLHPSGLVGVMRTSPRPVEAHPFSLRQPIALEQDAATFCGHLEGSSVGGKITIVPRLYNPCRALFREKIQSRHQTVSRVSSDEIGRPYKQKMLSGRQAEKMSFIFYAL